MPSVSSASSDLISCHSTWISGAQPAILWTVPNGNHTWHTCARWTCFSCARGATSMDMVGLSDMSPGGMGASHNPLSDDSCDSLMRT